MSKNTDTDRGDLIYGGICPVCGEEFVDGYSKMEVGESYKARICIDEKNSDGGKMLVHLPNLDDTNTDHKT